MNILSTRIGSLSSPTKFRFAPFYINKMRFAHEYEKKFIESFRPEHIEASFSYDPCKNEYYSQHELKMKHANKLSDDKNMNSKKINIRCSWINYIFQNIENLRNICSEYNVNFTADASFEWPQNCIDFNYIGDKENEDSYSIECFLDKNKSKQRINLCIVFNHNVINENMQLSDMLLDKVFNLFLTHVDYSKESFKVDYDDGYIEGFLYIPIFSLYSCSFTINIKSIKDSDYSNMDYFNVKCNFPYLKFSPKEEQNLRNISNRIFFMIES